MNSPQPVFGPKSDQTALTPAVLNFSKAGAFDIDMLTALSATLDIGIPDFKWITRGWIAEEVQKGNFYLAKHDQEVLGFLCFHQNQSLGTGYIESMAVRSGNQRRGNGRQIVKLAEELSRETGLTTLAVETFCAYGVVSFYEKCGLIRVEKIYHFRDNPAFPYYRLTMTIEAN